ncbi:MAG TPA: TldD/PmbA family protein [Sphingomonadaceae bacterium]|nr:TldD/PmbA family protein [Sphingomonadaceae bacterium]
MLTPSQAAARAEALVARAVKAGADAADAIYVADASTAVQVRLGALEDVGRSEGEEMGLRFFVGHRHAGVSSSDLSDAALDALVERAGAMAREASEDVYAGLAPEELLFRGSQPDLDSDDGGDPSPAALKSRALEAEDAARGVAGVTNSEGGSSSAGRSVLAVATSHGFVGGYASTGYSASASVIAGTGEGMQRDYASHSARHEADLEDVGEIGRRAGTRAVARLNPVGVRSGVMPVVFDPRVSSSLLGHLVGAITGGAITRGTSFLKDRLGQAVFAPGVVIRDDPLRRRGLRSKPFDGEGLPRRPTDIIADGVLTGWLLDSASARQLGLQPTGHAARGVGGPPGAGATNLSLLPGALPPEALMADIAEGLYVTSLIGQGVNGVTGDYSRGATGFLIVNGALGPAAAEITIAGNLLDMFATLRPANDWTYRTGVDAPTVRIDGMTAASA